MASKVDLWLLLVAQDPKRLATIAFEITRFEVSIHRAKLHVAVKRITPFRVYLKIHFSHYSDPLT